MAPRSSLRQKARPSRNASQNLKDTYAYDHDDIESVTTASLTDSLRGFNSDSDHDWRSPKPSPDSSPKTSLKSLQSKAKPFVPSEMPMLPPPPTCLPTPGKDCLAGAIQGTLGAELWHLNMMDCASYNGDWCTAVEITIPELSASMLHLIGSQDAEAIAVAQQANQAKVVQALTETLNSLKPNMVIQPADHRASLCVEYCAADRSMLCREFSHFCSCPRGGTCRWAHAMIETFMINFILAPLAQWVPVPEAMEPQMTKSKPTPSIRERCETERWQPSRPPLPPREEDLSDAAVEKPRTAHDDACSALCPRRVEDEIQPIRLAPDTRPKNPRLVSRRAWADIQEESDDE